MWLFLPNQQIFVNMLFFHQWQNFFARRSLETPELAIELRILLLFADFANHVKFVFSRPAWAAYGFALATKGTRQNHMARGVTRGEGAQFPGRLINMGRRMTAERQKILKKLQVLCSIQWICFLKSSGSNMGAPNLLLIPGAIYLVTPLHMAISHYFQVRNQEGR